MSYDVIKVLFVEDNPADAYLLQKLISTDESIELIHTECLDDAIDCLNHTDIDAILLDLSLPNSQGLKTFQIMHSAEPEKPILVLTGLDDEETAIAALREGAQDYLIKGDIPKTWLIRCIHYAIERQQHLDELQHLNDELQRSNQELGQFAYVVSHDLQQPLQVILGFSKLLELKYSDQLELSDQKYISNIIRASQHMSQLIRDLLNYSRVGRTEPSIDIINCNLILEKVLSNLQSSVEESNAVVIIEDLPTLVTNETHVMQLFENLLSNALKYHLPSQSPQVHISAIEQQKSWLFEIKDNGIGIKSEDCVQIFQIFKRLHTKEDYPGTGIGLATCKKIVENLGGDIGVTSEVGSGSTFFFTLPTSLVMDSRGLLEKTSQEV